jgi:orotidine-5'-phosphate decarboxylase
LIWTDEKLRDIPSTTFQTAGIIYTLGYDAIHCMPQLGPDVAGALQLAAQRMGKGTVHVINMTHPGYKHVKEKYFKDSAGTVELMREEAMGLETTVDIGKGKIPVRVRATGTIEPANRPDELFLSTGTYGDDIMIISIGIGPQGALPGSALYAGAHIEGIGRFIFERESSFETPENMARKARACKRSCLRALGARYSKEPAPYPLGDILSELQEFDPQISAETRRGLDIIYEARKNV